MEQNSTSKNIAQVAALMALSGIAIAALMAIPTDDNPIWFISLFGSKALAAAGFYATYKLELMWRPGNKILQAYDRACKKAEEAPNPMYIGKEEDE